MVNLYRRGRIAEKEIKKGPQKAERKIRRNQHNNKNRVIYFAHPINTYYTHSSKKTLNYISYKFSEYSIINPETDIPQYIPGNKIMEICFGIIKNRKTEILVFISDNRNFIGKGVHDEVKLAEFLNKKVYYYYKGKLYDNYSIKIISDEDWENYARVEI